LCKANIIAVDFKSKNILFARFFQENVRNCIMAHSALLSTLLRYTTCPFRSGLFNKSSSLLAAQSKTLKFTFKAEQSKLKTNNRIPMIKKIIPLAVVIFSLALMLKHKVSIRQNI